MALTVRKIEEMAPDQASLNAANKLRKPAAWPVLGQDSGDGLIWGECQGSGSTPYRVMAALDDLGYKCTCPSRKFPCKHVLAMLWSYALDTNGFADGAAPDWVGEWLSRRRPKGAAAAKPKEAGTERPSASAAAAEVVPEKKTDAKSEVRAAAQRERQREAREQSIAAGLEELQLWIADQLERGVTSFIPVAFDQCRLAARRMADAKAPGLSTWLDSLPSRILALPEAMRMDAAIEALGGLALLAEAYRRQDSLPPELRADVRRLVGWTQTRDALLADGQAPRAKGVWHVVATRSEVQPDKLRRIETWLARGDVNGENDGQRFAVVMDFTPVGTGAAASPFSVGETIEAELVFYPSAVPLRAIVADRGAGTAESCWSAATRELPDLLDAYAVDLAHLPWLGDWPFAAHGAVVASAPDGLYLSDPDSGLAIPIADDDRDAMLPLVGLDDLAVFGLWDGRLLSVQAALTPLGAWSAGGTG